MVFLFQPSAAQIGLTVDVEQIDSSEINVSFNQLKSRVTGNIGEFKEGCYSFPCKFEVSMIGRDGNFSGSAKGFIKFNTKEGVIKHAGFSLGSHRLNLKNQSDSKYCASYCHL